MKVFNPGQVPVVVDDGVVVPANEHADIAGGAAASAAVERGVLLDQTPADKPAPPVADKTAPSASSKEDQ